MEASKKKKKIQPILKPQSDISAFFLEHSARKILLAIRTKNPARKRYRREVYKQLQLKSWKPTPLAFKYNADDWLIVSADRTTNLEQLMNCSVCTKFMDGPSSVKGFQQQWCESGSKRLQHSAALEHAERMSHKNAFDLHLKGLEIGIRE